MLSGRLPEKDCNQSEEMAVVIFGYAGRLSAEGHHPLLFRKCLQDLNLELASYPYTLTVKFPFFSEMNCKVVTQFSLLFPPAFMNETLATVWR